MGISLRLDIRPEPEPEEYDIVIDIEDEIILEELPYSYVPITAPVEDVEDGVTGRAFRVEDGRTNLLLDSSFEDSSTAI